MAAYRNNSGIRLLALDLDGTTLRHNGTLGERTAQAIRKAVSCGIEVVPATGRAYSTLPCEVVELEGLNYVVTSNGAAVYKIKNGERIWSNSVSENAAERIMQEVFSKREKVCLEVFIDGIAYGEERYVKSPAKFARVSAIGYV